jgi:hypothetical protein
MQVNWPIFRNKTVLIVISIVLLVSLFGLAVFTDNKREPSQTIVSEMAVRDVLSERITRDYMGVTNFSKENDICEDDPSVYVVTVDCYGVTTLEFESRKKQREHFYIFSDSEQKIDQNVETEILNQLVSQLVTEIFLFEKGDPVSRTETEAYVLRVKKEQTEQEYLSMIEDMYGIGKEEHLQQLSFEIAKERVQQLTGISFNEWISSELKNRSVMVYR